MTFHVEAYQANVNRPCETALVKQPFVKRAGLYR